jgi:hypothetical protein
MAGTRLLSARGLAPVLGRAQRGLAARVVAKADAGGGGKGGGKGGKGKKDEGGALIWKRRMHWARQLDAAPARRVETVYPPFDVQ